ncbi:MAG: c-type cytochrome biogenesis protein CcmI [Burkholderiales bacterium]
MVSSPLFWLFAFALLVGTLALLVPPLLRRAAAIDAPGDESAATAVFRDHKRQIEADFAANVISAPERDAALADLAGRFGDELRQETQAARPASERPRWIAAIVIVALVPVVAGALYYSLGNPTAMSAAAPGKAGGHANMTDPANDPQMASIVDGLAKRLQANPDDGEGWAMLGRSYRVLGRFEAAAMAYGEAAKRLPPNAAVYTEWAEAVAQSQGKSLGGLPTELLDKALAADPDYQKALALAGSAALERNDRATAAKLWTKLRASLPPDNPNIAEVDAALKEIGVTPPPSSAAAVKAPAAPAAVVAAPSPKAAPAAPPAAPGAASIEGRVEIDPKLAGKIAPGDTVFVLARDPDGSRMPLAALKLTGADLPKAFSMSDAMAMSDATTISKAKRIVVEARVSKSGNAMLQPGDLTGTSAPVAPGARDVRVTIDRVVP